MNFRALVGRLAHHFQFCDFVSFFEALKINLTVPVYFHFEKFRERIHHGNAHAVQASRDFIALVVEFTAGMQLGHNHFKRGNMLGFVHIHRDTPTVVNDNDAVVRQNLDVNKVAVFRQRFVDTVVHHLVDEVMQPLKGRVADIHGRSFPDRREAFQNLYICCTVTRISIRHLTAS